MHQGADRSRARDCREDRLDKQARDKDRTDTWGDHQDRDRDTSAAHRGHRPGQDNKTGERPGKIKTTWEKREEEMSLGWNWTWMIPRC